VAAVRLRPLSEKAVGGVRKREWTAIAATEAVVAEMARCLAEIRAGRVRGRRGSVRSPRPTSVAQNGPRISSAMVQSGVSTLVRRSTPIPDELRTRWETPEGREVAKVALQRLRTGKAFEDLGLGSHEGRVDLRGLPASMPILRPARAGPHKVSVISGNLELRRVRLQGLDLSGALLQSLRLFDVTASDCRFDGIQAPDFRSWSIHISRSSFVGAQLPEASIGAPYKNGPSSWTDVDFTNVDLRHAHAEEATFERCRFDRARLDRADFMGSSFIDCRFAGVLRGVMFNSRGWQDPLKRPLRPFTRIDLSDAILRDVEFRNINLDDAILPRDPDHLIIEPFGCTLEHVIQRLDDLTDSPYGGWRARLEAKLAHAAPSQRRGVIDLEDFTRGRTQYRPFLERLFAEAVAECSESGRLSGRATAESAGTKVGGLNRIRRRGQRPRL
jgi:uncharacterized protein YjbI with pentapeptide repeats